MKPFRLSLIVILLLSFFSFITPPPSSQAGEPVVSITAPSMVAEHIGNFPIYVNYEGTSYPFSINYRTVANTAVAGQDFQHTSGTLLFSSGETQKIVTMTLVDNDIYEASEIFSFELHDTEGNSVAISDMMILDNEPAPLIGIYPREYSSAPEGNNIQFIVGLSTSSAQTVTVDYTTADGTATSGSDYGGISGTLVFEPGGQLTQTLSVELFSDSTIEDGEYFFISLHNVTHATIEQQSLSVGITDASNLFIGIVPIGYSTVEEGGTISFEVGMTSTVPTTVTVGYSTISGTAIEGLDFVPISGTITFPPGTISTPLEIQTIDDSEAEPLEQARIILLEPYAGEYPVGFENNQALFSITSGDTLVYLPVVRR